VSLKSRQSYVAFLRGVNVGGHRKIKMVDLVAMFEAMGHREVRTLLASGNVIFTAGESDHQKLTIAIETALRGELGYQVDIVLRTVEHMQALVAADPYSQFAAQPGQRYVTFYRDPPDAGGIVFPVERPDLAFTLVALEDGDLLAIGHPLPDGRHGDFTVYAKGFGAISTTRNWNTVVKLAAL
jgi:uncharacterized protein (DUF1697 family)